MPRAPWAEDAGGQGYRDKGAPASIGVSQSAASARNDSQRLASAFCGWRWPL